MWRAHLDRFVESTISRLMAKRFVKKQQMRYQYRASESYPEITSNNS
jgi:hypothetical protein